MAAAHLILENLSIGYGRRETPVVERLSASAQPGELLALLGPSGSGKSSTLLCIAGFLIPVAGDILIDGRSVLALPPERRETALVFQQPALFPHLNIHENVAFGLRMRRVRRAEREHLVRQALADVQLQGYGEQRPHQLSGGQRQRVALARALITRPRLLLLDEPFTALDPELRDEMRALLTRLQRAHGLTSVLVTHDQQEAARLADRVAVLIAGRLQQIAPPETCYLRPASLAVARFLGVENIIPGYLQPDRLTVATDAGNLSLAGAAADPGPVALAIRPEHITLAAPGAGLPGELLERQFLGNAYRYRVAVGGLLLTALRADSAFAPGATVSVLLPPEHLVLLPADW